MAKATITVLAGTNGAGKSSIAGEYLRQSGAPHFDPDAMARELLAKNPGLSPTESNGLAWQEGMRQLKEAIRLRKDFIFETTLGGNTVTATIEEALDAGLDVRIWYVGLMSPELHIARVQARVAKGGHAIPPGTIRQRFNDSRLNLIRLMGRLAELKVFDNSAEADPHQGQAPQPILLLHLRRRRVMGPSRTALAQTPDWAKPIVEAALSL